MKQNNKKNVVVIGGGTGTSTVVTALRSLPVSITALVSVADSGGSTGRLRDEFGFQPVGDLRQSLAALAQEKNQEWIRKVLLYRFEKGDGLKGHNLGNLLLTALQEMTGSTVSALEVCEKIFRLQGTILPVTTQNVDLVVEYESGETIVGEHKLDDNGTGNKKIKRIYLKPDATLYDKAREAIENADSIIIGPGDYYSSIMPALAVRGMASAFKKTSAQVIYISNLMTRLTQTNGMTVKDHVDGLEKEIRKAFDSILVNNGKIPDTVLSYYAKDGEYPVIQDMQSDTRVIERDVVMTKTLEQSVSDTAHRSILRHDTQKLSQVLETLL